MKTANNLLVPQREAECSLPSPVFILSCERSGSTLLRYIVDTHPAICAPAQLYLGRLCQALYTAAYYSVGQLAERSDEQAREAIARQKTRMLILDLMHEYTQGKQKQVWCEKSTDNVNHLAILNTLFPTARWLCLYRHGMDVAYSCIECSRLRFMPELAAYVQKNPENIVAAMLTNWLEKNRTLLEFETQNPSRCFRLTYENLVTDPNPVLHSLFRFLGLEWEDGRLDAVFTQSHDQGAGDMKVLLTEKISTASLGKGSAIPRTSIPPTLLGEVNGLLESLGYPLIGAEYDPGWSYGNSDGALEKDVTEQIQSMFQERLPYLLQQRREQTRRLHGICKLAVSGQGGGIWRIDLTRPEAAIAAGEGKADCTIAVSSCNLLKILDGRLPVMEAIQQGELGATGNMELAKGFGRLLLA
jgi:protein-tyrosine sulfotransferase